LVHPPISSQEAYWYEEAKDGLEDVGLDRYGYAISEGLVLRTSVGTFRRSLDPKTGIADGGDLKAAGVHKRCTGLVGRERYQSTLDGHPGTKPQVTAF